VSRHVGAREIFLAFLLIGATSFGGGVMAYLRSTLVARRRWVDDETFLELLTISQTLPGLKATNMAILVGDRLCGARGAIAAITGLCLPGAVVMFVVGLVYQAERERPLVEAALDGVAAAAVGLILATILELGRKSFSRVDDLAFILLTVVCVNRLHVHVAGALIGVGALAAAWYGFSGVEKTGRDR
jgi:chromate transporter